MSYYSSMFLKDKAIKFDATAETYEFDKWVCISNVSRNHDFFDYLVESCMDCCAETFDTPDRVRNYLSRIDRCIADIKDEKERVSSKIESMLLVKISGEDTLDFVERVCLYKEWLKDADFFIAKLENVKGIIEDNCLYGDGLFDLVVIGG